jgi:hypothetical protein
VLSLIGDVAEGQDGPSLHAHVVLGLPDGTTRGGHLIEGQAAADPMPGKPGRVGQQRRKPLHPPVHGDMIHLDATVGQQLLHIPIGQAEPQIPAHRQHDHIRWEAEPGERRAWTRWTAGRLDRLHADGSCRVIPHPSAQQPRPWPHSTITVVSGPAAHTLKPAYPDTPSPYQVIPDRGATAPWTGWVRPSSPAPRCTPSLREYAPITGGGWEAVGVNIAVFDVPPGGEPRFSSFLATPTGVHNPVYWSGGILYDAASGYVYVFGSSVQATDGWTGHDDFAARVALRELCTPNRWRFFASGSWTPVQASATPILRTSVNSGTETVFSLWRDGSGWKLTSKRGGQWGPGAIVRWTAPTLGTAWTETVVADIPGDHYIHYEHLALPLTSSGQRLLTYNTTGADSTWTGITA